MELDPLNPGRYHCANHRFEIVNSSIFSEPQKVQILSLSSCGVREIQPNAFATLTNLKALTLSFNYLTEIKKTDFAGLNQLKRIFLIKNEIKKVDHEAFQLPSLNELSLVLNPIDELDLGAFAKLSALERLYVGRTTRNIKYPGDSNVISNLFHLGVDGNRQADGNTFLQKLCVFSKLRTLTIEVDGFVGGVKINSILNIFPDMQFLIINNCRVRNLGENFENDKCVQGLSIKAPRDMK